MADSQIRRLTHLKIDNSNEEIPISVFASNIVYDLGSGVAGNSLTDALGEVAFKTKGSIQTQINRIENIITDLQNGSGVSETAIQTAVNNWLTANVVSGQGVTIDPTLKRPNEAAQAKATGDMILVDQNQPQNIPTNKIWIKPSVQSIEVPTTQELENIIAPKYDENKAYQVGEYALYNNNSIYSLYKCKTAINNGGETWNPAHWEKVSLAEEFKQILNN